MTYVTGYSDLAASPSDGGWDAVGTYQHHPNGFVQGGFSVHTGPDGDHALDASGYRLDGSQSSTWMKTT